MPLDFEFTEAQKLLQNSAREFAAKEFTREVAMGFDQREEFPLEVYKRCCRQGYIGIAWPEQYGGQGLTPIENMIVNYEFCKADPSMGYAIHAGNFGSDIIAHAGTPEQKAKWLPRLTRGEIISAGCFTEPAGGSDLGRVLDTRAVKQGDFWVVNGAKTFITNITTASIFVTLVQTDLQAKPPYRGQTEFIIEKGPGVGTEHMKGKMGWKMSPTGDLTFNDVKVTEHNIVGGPSQINKGFYMAISFLDEARLNIGAMSVATADAALDKAVAYARERQAFGRKIGGFQGLAHRLVEMATRVELGKSLCYRGAWLTAKAKTDPSLRDESIKIASMLKWSSARLAVESCDLLVDVYGGAGYFTQEDVSRWYVLAKQFELVEGTKEVQKNAIARILLGPEIVKTF